MTATKTRLAGLATATLLTASAHAATITSVSSGDYETGSNWDTGNVPGEYDDAIVTSGYVMTSSSNLFFGNTFFGVAGTGSLTVTDGSVTAPEIGLAFLNNASGTPSTASLNIGSLGLVTIDQIWVSAATAASFQNDVSINFTGDGGTLTILTGFGSGGGTARVTSNNVTAFSTLTFEELWDAGYLTKDGVSGLDGAVFSENFALSQTGDDANDTITAIPEPSSLALLGIGGLMIARRRRG